MPNLRRPFRLKTSARVDSRQCVNPCVCVCGCDYLPSDPRISHPNLNNGKGNHTSSNDFFFNLLYSLVSVWTHFPSFLSCFFTLNSCLLLSQYPSFFILYPAIMSCFYVSPSSLPFLPQKLAHLAAIFFTVMTCFSSVLSHTPRFFFRKTRLIILRGEE